MIQYRLYLFLNEQGLSVNTGWQSVRSPLIGKQHFPPGLKCYIIINMLYEYLLGYNSPLCWKGNLLASSLWALTGGGKPQVSLCALFQAWAGTQVEPSTFRKLAGFLKKKHYTSDVILTLSGEGQVMRWYEY